MRTWLLALVVGLVLTADAQRATAAPRRACARACAARIELDCGALAGRRHRRCRNHLIRECRRTSPASCGTALTTTSTTIVPVTSTSTVTTTSVPTTTTMPVSSCGNGVIDPGEVCDGAALGDGYCIQGGPVTCLPSCGGWNYDGCFHCGNGIREGLEECDGDDVAGAACPEGSTGGSPVCDQTCDLDDTPCVRCGDGDLDPGEWCDDGNTTAGDGCSPTCSDECGDGMVEPPYEECDDGGRMPGDGCDAFCLLERIYAGGGDEQADVCALEWGASTSTLGSTLTCHDGEAPCDRGPSGDLACRFRLYACVNNPLFAGTPCTWTGVSRVELTGDSLSGPGALGAAEQASVLDAFGTMLARWGGAVVTGEDPMREATPAVTADVCAAFELDVATGTTKVLSLRVSDTAVPPDVDDDTIALVCAQ